MLNDGLVTIQGSDKIITSRPNVSFGIEEGRVYVFVVPYDGESSGRRMFAAECRAGDIVPPLCTSQVMIDAEDYRAWRFVIVPMEETKIRPLNTEDAHFNSFRSKLGLENLEDSFEHDVVEKYRINMVRGMRNLYAAERQSERAEENSFRLMLKHLTEGRKSSAVEITLSPLYDAMAYVCKKKKIGILPCDVIRSSCGSRFDAEDIAMLSGFPIRRVTLEEGWFKRECGEMLVYYDDKSKPMALIPRGLKGCDIYDPKEDATLKVTAEIAEHILPTAIAVYSPLPARELDFRDITLFAKTMLNKRDIVFNVAIAIIGTLLGLLIPFMNEQIYDIFIPQGDARGLTAICLVILSCLLGNVAFNIVKGIAGFRNNTRMQYAVEVALYDRVFKLPDRCLRETETADMIQRIVSVSQLFNTVVNVIETQLVGVFLSFIYLFKMLDYSPELSHAAIIMVFSALAVMVFISISCFRLSEEKMTIDGKISSMLFQFLSGITKLKHSGAEERALNEYIKEYTMSTSLTRSLRGRVNSVAILGDAAAIIFSMVLFFIMIKNSLSITTGQFMGFNAAFSSFSASVLALANAVATIGVMIPAINRAKVLMDSVPETDINLSTPGKLRGNIEVSNVSFKYGENERMAVKNLNINIKNGEYIGIVGPSGCGKSTLLKLLLGFESPTEGKIFYDEMDIDEMNKRQLRKRFGVVLQNGALIPGSIYENVTVSAPDADANQVMKIMELVGMKEDIDSMPMGLNTVLSEGDGQISGGQKQRLLIARAIINRPEIIFLDEATSALDNITQAKVAESLEGIKATRVVIAHRLSTIMNCDRILVMDEGRIVEEGNFEELMKTGGLFAEFAERQM